MNQIAHTTSLTESAWRALKEHCSQQCGGMKDLAVLKAPGPALSNRAGRVYFS
jgi:hypothetical protein